jgi:ferredoxin
MGKITVKPKDSIIDAPDNQRLILALVDSGVDILHRCGGNAKCTTCRVQIVEGEPSLMTEAEHEKLTERGLLGQYRLACQILCDHDMAVRPIMSLRSEGLDDRGSRPEDQITPPAVWTTK